MYQNIVLTGGSAMFNGLKERIQEEVQNLLNKDPSKPVREVSVHCDSHRRYATWIGGSMLASMSTFAEFKIFRKNYMDSGTRDIIMKKGF